MGAFLKFYFLLRNTSEGTFGVLQDKFESFIYLFTWQQ